MSNADGIEWIVSYKIYREDVVSCVATEEEISFLFEPDMRVTLTPDSWARMQHLYREASQGALGMAGGAEAGSVAVEGVSTPVEPAATTLTRWSQ